MLCFQIIQILVFGEWTQKHGLRQTHKGEEGLYHRDKRKSWKAAPAPNGCGLWPWPGAVTGGADRKHRRVYNTETLRCVRVWWAEWGDSAPQTSGNSRASFRLLTSKPHCSRVPLSKFSLPATIPPSYQPCTHLCTSHLPPTVCTCQTMLKCCSFLSKKSDTLIALKGFLF